MECLSRDHNHKVICGKDIHELVQVIQNMCVDKGVHELAQIVRSKFCLGDMILEYVYMYPVTDISIF